jgi:hypothetical protein
MKHAPKKEKGSRRRAERPMEFQKEWQELEAQHDNLKYDWGSLAAQLGISSGGGY